MRSTSEIVELARRRYMGELPLARSYRPGKFSAVGFPKEERATVCQVEGAGILKRLWTTHSEGTRIRLYLYIDDAADPVLQGWGHEIALAASRISCWELPWGGIPGRQERESVSALPLREGVPPRGRAHRGCGRRTVLAGRLRPGHGRGLRSGGAGG
ncbi:hypothetical protein ACFL6X_06725 [Candidatus Latescibacterota bacterium]